MLKISVAAITAIFVATCLSMARPVSDGGKLSFKLALVNAIGWLFILPLSTAGHPPAWLILFVPFWLLNLVLLPAATFALWKSYKEREEKRSYLAVAGTYVCLNVVVLFLIPVIMLAGSVVRA